MAVVIYTKELREFMDGRALALRSLMDQNDANATGKTEKSIRIEAGEDFAQLFGSHAFNLNKEGRPSLDFGSPQGTLVPIDDLKAWAASRGYNGNIHRLQTRIFERGTRTVNNENPRQILSKAFDGDGIDKLKQAIAQSSVKTIGSQVVELFKQKT